MFHKRHGKSLLIAQRIMADTGRKHLVICASKQETFDWYKALFLPVIANTNEENFIIFLNNGAEIEFRERL